jgi:CRISPR-associated protein Csd1
MILQALYDYYQRKAADPESKIAPYGLEWKEIPFLIVIDKKGTFVNLEDTRTNIGKQKIAKRFLVNKTKIKTGKNSWQTSNVLWENYGYVLSQPKVDPKKTPEINLEDARKQHCTFLENLKVLAKRFPENDELEAVSLFYKDIENITKLKEHPSWNDCLKIAGCNLSFRVAGFPKIVAEHDDVISDATKLADKDSHEGICLITGEKGPIATLHSGSTIPGGKAGAKIVGFQKGSGYDSYHKIQGLNAPVSLKAEAAYTTALNTLLAKESQNKFKLGDTTYLFWAEKDDTLLEKGLSFLMNAPPKDNPDRHVQEVKSLLQSVNSGIYQTESATGFFILGLAPNAARIAIRLWKAGTTSEIMVHLATHFEDLKIVPSKKDPEYFSLFNLLSHTALEYKVDNVQPNLSGAVLSAAINGTKYPETLQQQCLRRNKAEQKVTYIRASILKACLNRKIRINKNTNEKEITMALDLENINPGYLCGRLFAVLEKIQSEALPGLNATIKDRYYGAASSTPVTVFGRLLTMTNHHLSKLSPGRKINMEKQLQTVISQISGEGFPKHLSLDDQSRFAIGYYHQRQDLYTKKEDKIQEEV